MARSRLRSHIQEQSIHSILLATGGIITIIVLLVIFGPQLLINFSLLVKKSSDANEPTTKVLSYIAPPVLNPINEATNSAEVIISGYAQEKQEIRFYVNGKQKEKTTVKKDNQFSTRIKLEKGTNEIKAKAVLGKDKESDYSETTTIIYINEPPSIDISFPQDGQTFSKDNRNIIVRGKTNENVKVTVNDFWAITKDDGSFSYSLSIPDGEHIIRIKATDAAGNETTKEIKVKVE